MSWASSVKKLGFFFCSKIDLNSRLVGVGLLFLLTAELGVAAAFSENELLPYG